MLDRVRKNPPSLSPPASHLSDWVERGDLWRRPGSIRSRLTTCETSDFERCVCSQTSLLTLKVRWDGARSGFSTDRSFFLQSSWIRTSNVIFSDRVQSSAEKSQHSNRSVRMDIDAPTTATTERYRLLHVNHFTVTVSYSLFALVCILTFVPLSHRRHLFLVSWTLRRSWDLRKTACDGTTRLYRTCTSDFCGYSRCTILAQCMSPKPIVQTKCCFLEPV